VSSKNADILEIKSLFCVVFLAAAQVAYEVMLQEDFTHELKVTLSMLAAVKHFTNTMSFDRYEPPVEDPDEVCE